MYGEEENEQEWRQIHGSESFGLRSSRNGQYLLTGRLGE